MAATSRDETTKRLNRLAGSGRGSGGGLPLPALFSAMLNEVLDSAPVSTERMTEITSSVLGFKQQAVFATWPAWEALADDALAQMESRKVIQNDDGSWTKGTKLVTGQRIEIIPARPEVGSKSDGVTVWTKEVREARSSADHAIRTFGEQDTEVAQRGSRRVTTARKELILESIRQLGDMRDYFPVLLDDQGNVIDGRHRREIDPAWPASRVRVPAEHRLAAAAAANRTSAWSERDWKDLLGKVIEATGKKTEAVRTLIRLALLEDASRSDREIGRLVGCSNHTVSEIRSQLVQTEQIAQFQQTGGRGVTVGTPNSQPSRVVPEETKEALTQEAMRRLEAGEHTDFRGLAVQYGVGEPLAQQCIAIAKDRLKHSARQPDPVSEPESESVPTLPPAPPAHPQSSPTSQRPDRRPRPVKLMQRISRLLSRWEGEPDDPASEFDATSELEDLEALQQELEAAQCEVRERIEALRR